MKYIVIDGRRYLWRDILYLRQEQKRQQRPPQPMLFELRHDVQQPAQRTSVDRYVEPSLFEGVDR